MAGLLNLVDLAGSERLSKSGATGDRLKETQARSTRLCATNVMMQSMQLTVEKGVHALCLTYFPLHQLLGDAQAINKSLSSLGAPGDVTILLCFRAAHTWSLHTL